MNVQILFLLYALSTFGGIVFSKQCSTIVSSGPKERYFLYFLVNSAVSCLFFFFNGGVGVRGNLPTLGYALLFAGVVMLSLLSTLLGYRLLNVSGLNVITGSCSLVTTSMVGCLLFGEGMNFAVALRIFLMVAAGLFVFWDGRKKEAAAAPSRGKQGLFLLLAVLVMKIVASTSNILINKAYAQASNVADENSFFFFTNLLVGVMALVGVLYSYQKDRGMLGELAYLRKPRQFISFSGNTLCSNLGSLVSLWILAQVNVSVFTPLSSAVGIVIGVLASLLFRERLGLYSYLAAGLACLALVI